MSDVPADSRPAWYAAPPRGRSPWRDWWTILHPPYTAWNLSYVLIGAGLAPHIDAERLLGTLLGFALAVGVAAHTLDELKGRPLGTGIASPVLAGAAAVSLGAAIALGVAGVLRVGVGLIAFVVIGSVVVVAYNLETWGGRLHSDMVFAAGWGAFPVLTAYFAQTGTLRPAALLGAAFAYGLSQAQRVLSTEARTLRRRVQTVEGHRVMAGGSCEPLSRPGLLQPFERALVSLSWSTCALGLGLVAAHVNL
jgi:hypothetical protein